MGYQLLMPLPSVQYESSRSSHDINRWPFYYNGHRGVSIVTALSGDLSLLDGKDDKFFDDTYKVKMRYCIAIEGYERFTKQKNIYHVKRGRRLSFTREKLVAQVAEVFNTFYEIASRTAPHNGLPLFGPGYIELEHVYLVELRQIGSTLQPIFEYGVQNYGTTQNGPFVPHHTDWTDVYIPEPY